MSELEDKLGAVLANPQMMQQIMALAQTMNQQTQQPSSQASSQQPAPPPSPQTAAPNPPSLPLDPALLQKIAMLTSKSGVDTQQRALLNALSPYLSRRRVEKLERAMRAARMTELASTVLGSDGLQSLLGRGSHV